MMLQYTSSGYQWDKLHLAKMNMSASWTFYPPPPVLCFLSAISWWAHVKDLQTLRLFGLRFGVTGSSSIPRQALHNHFPVLDPKLPTKSCSLNL